MSRNYNLDHLPAFEIGGELFSTPEGWALMEREILPVYVPSRRWFGSKARTPKGYTIQDVAPLGEGRVVLFEVAFTEGEAERYLLPLKTAPAATLDVARTGSDVVLARVKSPAGDLALLDALPDSGFQLAIYRLIAGRGRSEGMNGALVGKAKPALQACAPDGVQTARALSVEQSNSAMIFDDRLFMKLFRKLGRGINPDVEIMSFLGARAFPHVPPFCGTLEYVGREEELTLGLLLGSVANDGDAWAWALRQIGSYYDSVAEHPGPPAPDAAAGIVGAAFLDRVAQLGTQTGELHVALASEPEDPDFAPVPLGPADFEQLADTIRGHVAAAARTLRVKGPLEPAELAELGQRFLAAEAQLLARAGQIAALGMTAAKTRTHGDYHLGQVLNAGDRFVIIDFEGEPAKSLEERRQKRSPIRDVAGMLRSFHYAAYSGLIARSPGAQPFTGWAEAWSRIAGETFLRGWREATRGALFIPPNEEDLQVLLDAFLLEKALYEVNYELNNRPLWLPTPLRGVLALLD